MCMCVCVYGRMSVWAYRRMRGRCVEPDGQQNEFAVEHNTARVDGAPDEQPLKNLLGLGLGFAQP